jgi:hypothetical protein
MCSYLLGHYKVSLRLGGGTGSDNVAEIWGESGKVLATYATSDDFYKMMKGQFNEVGLDLMM